MTTQTRSQEQIKRLLIGRFVRLDGKPATISGRNLPFAVVRHLNAPGASFEWAWETAYEIVTTGGEFRS